MGHPVLPDQFSCRSLHRETPGHLVSATTLRSFCNLGGMASLELTVGLGPQILKNSKKMAIKSWNVTGIMMDWDKLVVPGLVNIQT